MKRKKKVVKNLILGIFLISLISTVYFGFSIATGVTPLGISLPGAGVDCGSELNCFKDSEVSIQCGDVYGRFSKEFTERIRHDVALTPIYCEAISPSNAYSFPACRIATTETIETGKKETSVIIRLELNGEDELTQQWDQECTQYNNYKVIETVDYVIHTTYEEGVPTCEEKWTDNYQCKDGNLERQWILSDCDPEWIVYEECEFGCSNVQCNDAPIEPECQVNSDCTGYCDGTLKCIEEECVCVMDDTQPDEPDVKTSSMGPFIISLLFSVLFFGIYYKVR